MLELLPGGSANPDPTRRSSVEEAFVVLRGARHVAAVASVGLVACGGGDDSSSGGGEQRGGGKEGGTLNGTYASFPDYLDPRSPTRPKAGRRWARSTSRCSPTSTPTAPKAAKSIPGLAEEHAEDHQRRQDLHADPAPGPQILRRHAGQSLRLHLRGRTHASSSTPAARPSTPTSSAPKSSPKRRRAASPGSKPTTRPAKSSST